MGQENTLAVMDFFNVMSSLKDQAVGDIRVVGSTSGAMIQESILQSATALKPKSGSFRLDEVGNRLHSIRKGRGLTLQEASRLTGVSTSAFSKIERGELSPTIGTLQRISEGLDLEITSLLNGEPIPQILARRSVNLTGEGRRHDTNTCDNQLLSADLRGKRMLPIRTRITARSIEEYGEWARSDSEIFLYILSGTIVMHSHAYEPLRLTAGESVYYDANIDHLWVSEGDDDAEVLWMIASR